MSKSKEYKTIKNYIHNELGLTKEDVIKEIRPMIERIVKQYMHNSYGRDNDMEEWVRHKVSDEIERLGPDFVRRMYREAIREAIDVNFEIVIKPKINN